MKVLQILKTNRGASWAFNQALKIKEFGIDIVTVLPNIDEGYAQRYKINGMKVIAGDWSLPILKPWKYFSIRREIIRVVISEKPDIIHFHFVTNVIMCRLALQKNVTCRLFQVPGPLHLENKFVNWLERKTSTKVDYWAGACQKTCDIYRNKGISKNKVFLAYYGIPTYNLKEKKRTNKLRDEYNIPNTCCIIAMVSYFYKPKKYLGQKVGIKGHEDFIKAMEIVLKKNKNVMALIIGNAWDGSEKYEEEIKKIAVNLLGDNVIFTGYRNDIYDIYPDIDIVVHPSYSENLGGAAESLLLGVPTIGSNVGGIPDIVIPEKTGCLVEPNNPKELADMIIWGIENQEIIEKLANNGCNLVSKLLDLNNTSTRVKEIYETILHL